MEVQKEKELKVAVDYQRIEQQREAYAGEDCLTVVAGIAVVAIGKNQKYDTCLDFIIEYLAVSPEKFMAKGQFTNAKDMYSYLFENYNDEEELKQFLKDYYDGMEMEDYGRL